MPGVHGGGRDKKDTLPPPPGAQRLQMHSYAQDKATQHPITEMTKPWLGFLLVLSEQRNSHRPFQPPELQETLTVLSTMGTK